jgi:hypothetical protein
MFCLRWGLKSEWIDTDLPDNIAGAPEANWAQACEDSGVGPGIDFMLGGRH